MVKRNTIILLLISMLFLLFSFYPTYFEISNAGKIDPRREFILEHNFYWPDFNLYLSKIRQGWEGNFTAKELYTSEPHKGSLIQEFYVVSGLLGRVIGVDPNGSYQLGRIILSALLLLVILKLVKYYFPNDLIIRVRPLGPLRSDPEFRPSTPFRPDPIVWQILALLIIFSSGSFPRLYQDSQGALHIGRFMEWWSNIDAVQRLTFIPHILFGQVVSFYLLYRLVIRVRPSIRLRSDPESVNLQPITYNLQLLFSIILGNLVGLTFPPSLITLDGVLLILSFIHLLQNIRMQKNKFDSSVICNLLYVICSIPSLAYILFVTSTLPWSALLDFHRTHPMMIPLDQYVLGTGPVFFLGIFGSVLAVLRRKTRLYPLILWIVTTFLFASFFSIVKEQSPLRFTQTGLFIPLGILTTYLFWEIYQRIHLSHLRYLSHLGLGLYLLLSLFMLTVSLRWQTTFISQRIAASIPLVPYPPQTMYPLKTWMDGIRWLKEHTKKDDVVVAEVTAGNFIPAYSGNTVYFGQSNTVNYDRKSQDVGSFFSGKMSPNQAELFLKNGRIRYIFFSFQEKELSRGKDLNILYPYLKSEFSNSDVTIYRVWP